MPNYSWLQYSIAAFTMVLGQSACMTNTIEENCSVEGAELLGGQITEDEICSRFKQQLDDAREGSPAGSVKNIALTLKKPATIDVVVVLQSDQGEKRYPSVSIDAIDRQLVASDLDRLAQATAKVLAADADGA